MAAEIKKQMLAMPDSSADQFVNPESSAEAKTLLDEMVSDVLRRLHGGRSAG